MPRVFLVVPRMIRDIIARLIRREGGYVDHPLDKGGPTKYGITIRTLSAWRGVDVTPLDVSMLEEDEAEQIYYQLFWLKLNLEHLGRDWWLKEFLFDWCVTSGLKTPIRQIQKLVNVKRDGILGPVTGNAIDHWKALTGDRADGRIVDMRIIWYLSLVKRRPSDIIFIQGWFNRANNWRYIGTPYVKSTVTGI